MATLADAIWTRYTTATAAGDRQAATQALHEWDAYCDKRGKGRPKKSLPE